MKAAVVCGAGQAPVYADFPDPVAEPGECLVDMRAAAISQLARARASGTHYSFDGTWPFVAGVDGTGVTEDGRRVYFAMARAPYGALAERVPVAQARCIPLPDDLDDVTAAALANPGMSSWMALRERAGLQPGEAVLINGATGVSGQLAVQVARHMGAGRILATGRNPEVLAQLKELGADEVIPLGDGPALRDELAGAFAGGIDVVLDYLWGPTAREIIGAAVKAAPADHRRRFVQIGSISGQEIALPGGWLRSSAIELMGSGFGSVPMPRVVASVRDLLAAAPAAGFRIAAQARPLAGIGDAWAAGGAARQVLTLG